MFQRQKVLEDGPWGFSGKDCEDMDQNCAAKTEVVGPCIFFMHVAQESEFL